MAKLDNSFSELAGSSKQCVLASSQRVAYGGMLIALVMVALCALVLYQSRRDATQYTTVNLRNIALIAERDIERNFDIYELSLQTIVERLRQPQIMALPSDLRRMILFDHLATKKSLGTILVVDSLGHIVIDSDDTVPPETNLAGQKYFLAQHDNPHTGFYISDPYPSPLRNGTPSIALSRRISGSDGAFGGVVVLVISLEYFRKLFGVLSLGPRGSVSLIGRDGVMIMRQPYDARIIGQNIKEARTFRRFISDPEGHFSETASIDGVRRLYWFKNFPDLPLIIMVAAAESDVYAAWRMRALTIGSLMFVFSAAFVALSFNLGAQLRRRTRAEFELRLLARTDTLTGLNNRRTLDEVLAKEWSEAKRSGTVFSLLFVDLDRFKTYNDTYGHQAGDDALAAAARGIVQSIRRPQDSAARYGGEEFVVLLPDTSASGARVVAERIRAAINSLDIKHACSEHGRLTASIGVASWTPGRDDDVTVVISAADAALYSAKADGRNRVAAFHEPQA
ncbi:sensor domain-containing diguanylate cyclase [Paraburkholderia fungorum]|uniref:sensor domain-containing diguanylate cyclase n=1 Tax=Paraburkholderia fungorum TaxID=134537 RepID=UPI00402B89E9